MTEFQTSTDDGAGDQENLGGDELASLAAAFARARGGEVPTYAPGAFRVALDAWESATTASGDAEQRRRALDEATRALTEAESRATHASRVLRDVARTRARALRDDRERYYAPLQLARAEEHYVEAIARAEEGDLVAAAAEADEARASFQEATLRSLEVGPLAAMENSVDEAEDLVAPEALRAARTEVADIRAALEATRQGNGTVAQLSRRISVGRGRIGSGLGEILEPPIIDPLPPGDPVWPPKPAPVDTIRVTNRAADQLTVTWLNAPTHADHNVLLRQRESGPWLPVAEFGPLDGWTTHTDTGLDPETLYAYRVRSENDRGTATTGLDDRAGGYTRALNSISVWRVQLAVRVADVSDAGTSDPIEARLTSPLVTFSPNGNRRWLDHGPQFTGGFGGWRDDFARGSERVYDLDQRYVRELADITMLTIAKDGSDAVGIAEVRLLVNNIEVFRRLFGETSSTCLWIDDGDGHQPQHTIWHGELRADPRWQAFLGANHFPPLRISNAEIVSRIEGLVGHAIHGTDAYWGEFHSPAWVEATFVDAERLHVDLDLQADVPIVSDPEVDIDFDLRFAIDCNPTEGTATLNITTENSGANVDFGFLTELFGTILTAGQFGRIEDYIATRIEENFEPIVQSIELQTGSICPTVTVQPNGDVTFAAG
ncbi:hypothetical protein [Microbacterium sp. E-13]|uniref:fibronectin type III domain-containing protein n=1 Tax=Microbacterium sp. E-13 TaxID=3404048 RepID=UPI003CF1F0E4